MLALYLSEIKETRDKDKFIKIYQTYEQKMFSIAYKILHHKENAEDAVHDAFEVIMKKLDVIEDVYSEDTWSYILVIVKNKAIRIYNKNKKKQEVMTDHFDLLEDLSDLTLDVETQIERKELSDVIASMILELPERCQDVLYLHYYKELSYVDIGRILDIKEENARQIARRGRKLLVNKMLEKGVRYE